MLLRHGIHYGLEFQKVIATGKCHGPEIEEGRRTTVPVWKATITVTESAEAIEEEVVRGIRGGN